MTVFSVYSYESCYGSYQLVFSLSPLLFSAFCFNCVVAVLFFEVAGQDSNLSYHKRGNQTDYYRCRNHGRLIPVAFHQHIFGGGGGGGGGWGWGG